jgi:hypothetical protein
MIMVTIPRTATANMRDLPILTAEAHSSSRRRSTYGTRAAYGLLLLGFFWIFHRNQQDGSAGRLLPNAELAQFAAAAFEWLAVGQALEAVWLLGPWIADNAMLMGARPWLGPLAPGGATRGPAKGFPG